MQLHYNCSVEQQGSAKLWMYRTAYRDMAAELGVRLASEDNPSKAFPPLTEGEILGLIYDGVRWTWKMPADKSIRLLLGQGIRDGEMTNREAMVLAGKINHYSNLVGGKYERCLIIHLADDKVKKDEMVKVIKQVWCGGY